MPAIRSWPVYPAPIFAWQTDILKYVPNTVSLRKAAGQPGTRVLFGHITIIPALLPFIQEITGAGNRSGMHGNRVQYL